MTRGRRRSPNTKQLRTFAKAAASEGKFWDVALKQSSCRKKRKKIIILKDTQSQSEAAEWDAELGFSEESVEYEVSERYRRV